MDANALAQGLDRQIDATLATQLVEEFVDIERNHSLRKWKYTELDGGRFAEVAARIVYSIDSGNYSPNKGVDECIKYVENEQVPHNFPERREALHLSRVIRAVYKLRSQRGAVHVSPTYTANEFDANLVVECSRWVFGELLRTFSSAPADDTAKAIDDLARIPHPLMRTFGDSTLLQAVDFTTEEEVLAHLFHARDGLMTTELVKSIPKDPSGVRRAIKNLAAARVRAIAAVGNRWTITDLGIGRIEPKLQASRI